MVKILSTNHPFSQTNYVGLSVFYLVVIISRLPATLLLLPHVQRVTESNSSSSAGAGWPWQRRHVRPCRGDRRNLVFIGIEGALAVGTALGGPFPSLPR